MSAEVPKTWTGTMAETRRPVVRLVRTPSRTTHSSARKLRTPSTSMLQYSSQSTKTGQACR